MPNTTMVPPHMLRAVLGRVFLFACLMIFAVLPHCAVTAGEEPEAAGGEKDRRESTVEHLNRDLAGSTEALRQYCVRVYIHGKSHEGTIPTVGDFGDDIRHERPTPVGGYWWDETHVIIEDPVLQDRYIRDVEISLPNSDKLYPARVAGRFVMLQAMLLEVLPDKDGTLPKSTPVQFEDGELEDAMVVSYGWDEGEWYMESDSGIGAVAVSDSEMMMVGFAASGLLVGEEGGVLGLAFGKKAVLDDAVNYWYGRELHYSPILSAAETATAVAKLRGQLRDAVLEARIQIRIRVDEEDEEEAEWTYEVGDGQLRSGDAEVYAPALVVGKRRLLVPAALPPEGIARIEGITIVNKDGDELKAEFVGALRDYMAIVVETKVDLPLDNIPLGFTLLDPASADPAAVAAFQRPFMEYFHRWRVDYGPGRRREVADYDRWIGSFRGYRGDAVVLTKTNEGDGSLAFDVEGRLVAVALTPRVLKSRDSYNARRLGVEATPGFRPVDFLNRKFADPDVFDPALQPVDEEQGQRLIDLGIEFQPLDRNSARLFHASRETRGGNIGLLVTHVYPGTIAAKIGLQEHDILLRIFLDGKKEPMELRSSGYAFAGAFDIGDMSSESFQSFLRYMPPPWPSRENVISTLLTAAGVGRKAVLEYMREGELEKAEFTTQYFEPDYRSAKKEKFPELGLTVKPVTYEVARYFGRTDKTGVIVSRVEVGSKSSVAGLHHYLLITHVDGQKVDGVDDFRDKVRQFEEGKASAVELTVESFGKTRLVKIE